MEKDTFYRDTFVLTLSNLAMGVLRFMFSILLSRQLGPEGVGLYGLIMPIYDLFCCIVCGGIIAAVSRESSAYHGTKRFMDVHKTINISFVFILMWSIFIAVLMLLITPTMCKYIIKDSRAIISLWILAPSIIFIACSTVFKGYFYGVNEVLVPSVIDIVEKAVRMVLLVGIIYFFSLKTIENTVAATYFSFTIGEIISFIFLYGFYKKSIRKIPYTNTTRSENRIQLLFNILVICVPLAINGFLTTALQSVSTLLVPRRLVASGLEYIEALEIIGKFNGMALAIVYFPLVIVNSLSTVIIPDLSRKISQRDHVSINNRVNEVIKICFMLGISTIIICYTCPKLLGELFFNRDDLAEFIKIASLASPFMYSHFCTYSILNGLGKQKVIVVSSLSTAIIEIVLIYLLIAVPSIHIYGYGISLIITSMVGLIINLYFIGQAIELSLPIGEFLIITLLSFLIFFISKIANLVIPEVYMTLKVVSIISIAFSLFFISTSLIRKSSS